MRAKLIQVYNKQPYYEIRKATGEIKGFALGKEQLARFEKEALKIGEELKIDGELELITNG